MDHKIQFVHFRVFDSATGDFSAVSGVTLGYKEVKPGKVHYAVAYCSPNDHYNKSIGRSIVTARLDDEDTLFAADVTFEEFRELCKSDLLHFQESYTDLLDELDDHFDIGLPMAYIAYDRRGAINFQAWN